MSCPFGSHSSQLGGSDLSVQAVTSTPTEALPYILSPGQSCFFFFLHFAYFSKVADISSHIKDPTSRFLKCNLNSSSPSYLSKLFSITDFKRDCVTPLCFFFPNRGILPQPLPTFSSSEKARNAGEPVSRPGSTDTMSLLLGRRLIKRSRELPPQAICVSCNNALMIQLALTLQQRQYFRTDPAI